MSNGAAALAAVVAAVESARYQAKLEKAKKEGKGDPALSDPYRPKTKAGLLIYTLFLIIRLLFWIGMLIGLVMLVIWIINGLGT